MKQRITIAEVIENEWFKKGYKPPSFEQADVSLDDVDAIFNESTVSKLNNLFTQGAMHIHIERSELRKSVSTSERPLL